MKFWCYIKNIRIFGGFMKKIGVVAVFLLPFFLISCFNLKESPFFCSEWVMENKDDAGETYLQQIFFNEGGKVTIQIHYKNNTSAIVWTGKYKISGKKINFKMENCAQMENSGGEASVVQKITRKNIINFYNGDFYYSLAAPDDEHKLWRLELIRPQNYFYGKNLDFMGKPLETFYRQEN
jgi:hypothetical protein